MPSHEKYEASVDNVLTTAWTENSFTYSDQNHMNVMERICYFFFFQFAYIPYGQYGN